MRSVVSAFGANTRVRQSTREAFVPLHHPPGHAQVDFGEAVVEVGGQREKVAFFCLILPHSDVWFVKAYPRETTEAFLDGHVSAFSFLGGVPRSILYDKHDACGGADPVWLDEQRSRVSPRSRLGEKLTYPSCPCRRTRFRV